MALVLRTSGEPEDLTASVRNELRTIDPDQPVFDVRTMAEVVSGSVAQPRFRTLLLGIFAGLALLLAAIGLYGVMAYSVTQRVNELGVRAALGAGPADILRLIVGHGLRLALAGIGVGFEAAVRNRSHRPTDILGHVPRDVPSRGDGKFSAGHEGLARGPRRGPAQGVKTRAGWPISHVFIRK
jgi:predicted lysophospholipase L1 biosynthesis ABC-type transport system permease subunit